MFRHLVLQETKWRAVVEAKVKVFTPAEVAAFAASNGLAVSPTVKESSRESPRD